MATKTREQLEQRQREIEFVGTQYALNSLEAPAELEHEYREISAAIAELDREFNPPIPPAASLRRPR